MSTAPPKTLCAKCFKSLQSEKHVKCKICNGKFHYICSDVNESNTFEIMKKTKNIIYNCNDCLNASSDLVSAFCVLSNEVRELKLMIHEFLNKPTTQHAVSPLLESNKQMLPSPADDEKSQALPSLPSTSITASSLRLQPNVPANLQRSIGAHAITSRPSENTNSSGHATENNQLNSKQQILPSLPDVKKSQALPSTSTAASLMRFQHNLPANLQRSFGTHTITNRPIENSHAANRGAENIPSHQDNTLTHRVGEYTSTAACSSNHDSDDVHIAIEERDNVTQADKNYNPVNNAEWVYAKSRRNRRKAIVGQNNTDELQVVVRKKWIHLSSFNPNVTEDQIIAYVGKHIDISINHMICYKLVKKDANIAELKSINFKLGISPEFYDELFESSLWPANVKIRPFKNFYNAQNLKAQT